VAGTVNSTRCRLNPEVRLLLRGEEGFILCAKPLKVWRVKRKALDLLSLCDGERTLEQILATLGNLSQKAALSFLERLAGEGVVELERHWTDTLLPQVSVVVAVRNRAEQIAECIQSLLLLDYPEDKLEIILVDDASEDSTPEQLARFPVKAILMSQHIGQSACRNEATTVAKGEIVAFTDSDCVVDPGWLAALVPFFADPRVAAVGGLVAPLSRASQLQRYEEVKSPLYQGRQQKEVGADSLPSYLSTCNFLVRKSAVDEIGGLDESMTLGEDVDLTWRLCDLGLKAVYSPRGGVNHGHRDRLWQFAKRRALYASSEALLLRKHPERRRLLYLPVALLLCLALLLAGLVLTSWPLAVLALAPFLAELGLKEFRLARLGLRLPPRLLATSTLRSYGVALHHILNNLSRYYLIPVLLLGLVSPYLLALAAIALLAPAIVDYLLLRPALNPVSFSAFYILENTSYQ
jgi:mycofactocin system glycosyltransferase